MVIHTNILHYTWDVREHVLLKEALKQFSELFKRTESWKQDGLPFTSLLLTQSCSPSRVRVTSAFT